MDISPTRVSGTLDDVFPKHLLEVFLVKLELERLTYSKSLPYSNAERALQIENKILKQRLRTLKDNIGILNGMIDQIKFSGGRDASTGRRTVSATKHGSSENALAVREFNAPDGPGARSSDHKVTAFDSRSDELRVAIKNSQSLKDQNQRLMGVNEKLLNESETLRKEIHRLRNLFGEDLYLSPSPNKQSLPQSLSGSASKADNSAQNREIDILKAENRRLLEILSTQPQVQPVKDDSELRLRITDLGLELKKVLGEKDDIAREAERLRRELEKSKLVSSSTVVTEVKPPILISQPSQVDSAELARLRQEVNQKDEQIKSLLLKDSKKEMESMQLLIKDLEARNFELLQELKRAQNQPGQLPASDSKESDGLKRIIDEQEKMIDKLNQDLKKALTDAKQIPGMKRVIDELEEQNEKLNQDLKLALSQLKSSTVIPVSVQPPQNQNSDLQDENVRLKSQLSSAEKEILRLKQNIEDLDQHIQNLSKPTKSYGSGEPKADDGQKDREIKRLTELVAEFSEQKSKSDKALREMKLKIADLESEGNKPADTPANTGNQTGGDSQALLDLRSKVARLEDALASKDIQLNRLNTQVENLLRQEAILNSKIANLESRPKNADQGPAPSQYLSEPVSSEAGEDLQSDLKKFSMIKKLVENHYQPRPSSVSVTKNPSTKDLVIDVQFEEPVGTPDGPPNTPGQSQSTTRKRIILPLAVFNGISRIRIDSNASTMDGGPSSDRIYRQSFEGPVRKTEVISTVPQDRSDVVNLDEDTANYFSLNKDSTGRTSLVAQQIPGYVLEKKISPELGKEYNLIQTLFNPNFLVERQEPPSNNKSLIKIEKYQGGTKSSESSTLVDPAKVKEMKDQMEEQVMNDIINILENQKEGQPPGTDQSPQGTPGVRTPASTTPKSGKAVLPEYVYRQTQTQEGGSARNIDKVKFPAIEYNPQTGGATGSTQAEILQKVTVKPLEISQSVSFAAGSLHNTPKGPRKPSTHSADTTRALVRIEEPGGFANKKIEYFRYERNSEGLPTLVPVEPTQAEKDDIDLLSKSQQTPSGNDRGTSLASSKVLARSDLSFGGQEIGGASQPPATNQSTPADIKFAQAVITNPLVLESLTEASFFKLKQDPATGSLVLEHLTKQPPTLPILPPASDSRTGGQQSSSQSGRLDRVDLGGFGYTPATSQRDPTPITQRSTVEEGGDLLQRIAAIGQNPAPPEQSTSHQVLEKFSIPMGDLSEALLNQQVVRGVHPPSSQEIEIQRTSHTPEGMTKSELVRLDVNKPDKKATVELLGVRDPAEMRDKDAQAQTKVEGLLEQLGGVGALLKEEAVKLLLQSNSPEGKAANINKELCEFLYLLFNADELEQAAKVDKKTNTTHLMVRVVPETAAGVKEYERIEVIDEPGESVGVTLSVNEATLIPKRIGLVTQRIKIEPQTAVETISGWKVTKDICDPRGLIHRQVFEVAAIDRNALPQKTVTPAKLRNMETQKSTTECKSIKLPKNITKYCITTFEVPKLANRVMKNLENLKPGQSVDGANIIMVKTSPTGEFLAEKHNIPLPGICYAELIEKSSVNLNSLVYGITVSFLPSGGAILEEMGPSQTHKDGIDTVQRVIMGDAEGFEKVEEVANQKKPAVEPSVAPSPFSGIISVLQKVEPRLETRDRDQRIFREKIKGAHKVTEDIIIPQPREYVVKLPSCLEKYDVFVKQREYKNSSIKEESDKDEHGLERNQLFRDLGGLVNLESLLSEVSSSPHEMALNPVFTVVRTDPLRDRLTVERFVVMNNSGSPLSNIKMLERVRLSRMKGSNGVESLIAEKEAPGLNSMMTVSKFKFSLASGIPLPYNGVKKIFEGTQTSKVSIDPYSPNPLKPECITARFDTEDAQGEYLRLLYACHEFLDRYLIVVGEDQFERKIELIRQADSVVPKTKEVMEISHTKGSGMAINRVILEPGETIEESILITLKGTDGDKSGTKKSMHTEGLSKTMMKLKKKVRTVRSAVGIKLKDPLVEDALDTLARQKLNGELEDLLRLAHLDAPKPASPGISLYTSTNDSAKVSVIQLSPTGQPGARLGNITAHSPVLSTEVHISKLAGVREIVGLFQSSLMESRIAGDNNKIRSETLRIAGYQQIKKKTFTNDGLAKAQEFVAIAPTNSTGLAQFQISKDSEDRAVGDEKTKASLNLARYLDFLCSLLNAPEHLLRPHSLLYERTHEGKMFVDRVDILQVPDIESGVVAPTPDTDPTAVSSNSVHQGVPNYQTKQLKSIVFMREELSIDPRLAEAIKTCAGLTRGSGGLDPVLLHDLLNQLPESIRTVTRKKVNTLGLVEVDSILVELKSSGTWNNTITERNIIEAKPLGPAVTEKELKRAEKIPDSMGTALRAFIYKRKETAPNNKTVGYLENEDGEVNISSLNPMYTVKTMSSSQVRVAQVQPLAVTLEALDLKKSQSFNYDESDVKYNFMLGSIEEIKGREEFAEPGNKIKINTLVLKPDLSTNQIDSLTIPKLTSWDSNLTFFGLFGVFPLKHSELSKADYFVRRRVMEKPQEGIPANSVVYEIIKFIYSIEGSQLIVVERSIFPREHDPFVKVTRGRGADTFALTEDDIYSKLAGIGTSPQKETPRSGTQEGKNIPFDSLVNQSAVTADRGPLKSAKSGLFDNMGKNLVESFDDSDEFGGNFDDDDSVVVNKSMNTLGRFSDGVRKNEHLERIATPLIAVLKAMELHVPATESKDCILIERKSNGSCVFEIAKMGADPRTLDVTTRIATESELAVFKPIGMVIERFNQTDAAKTSLQVTPDLKFTTQKTEPLSIFGPPVITSTNGIPSLSEMLETLSRFATSLKNPRYYLRIAEDDPKHTVLEVFEIIDKGREQIHERMDVPKKPTVSEGDPMFTATRITFTPEGQTEELIEFKLKSAGSKEDQIKIVDAKLKQTLPQKPYHNLVREKSRADVAGIKPTKVGHPVNTDAILDLLAKEAAINPQSSLIRQEIEGDKKIIERWAIDPATKETNLAERFLLKVSDLIGSTTQEQSISQIPKYLIRPDKTPEGTLVIKVFKIVDPDQKEFPGNELAAPISPAEGELWRGIKKMNDSKRPEDRVPELKVPSATLLIKEYWMGRLGTVSHQIEKTVLPLGDIIGYTLDGQPIYKKQLKDSTAGNVIPTSPAKMDPLPVEQPDTRNRPGLNRFDSMDLQAPVDPPVNSPETPHLGPVPARPAGLNMFESQTDDQPTPQGGSVAPDSGRTDPAEVSRLVQENSRLINELSILKSQVQPQKDLPVSDIITTSQVKPVQPDSVLTDSVKKVLSVLQSVILVPQTQPMKQPEPGDTVAIDPALVARLVEVSELAADQMKRPSPSPDMSLQIENTRLMSMLDSKDRESQLLKKNLDEVKDLLSRSAGEDPAAVQTGRLKAIEAELASREVSQQVLSKQLTDLQTTASKKDEEINSLRQELRNQKPISPEVATKELTADKFVTGDLESLIKNYIERGYLSAQPAPRMIVPVEVEQINAVIKGSKKLNSALEGVQSELNDARKDRDALAQKERNARDELQRSQSAQKQLQNELNLLQTKLAALEKSMIQPNQGDQSATRILALESEIASRKLEHARMAAEVDSLRNQLQLTNAQADSARSELEYNTRLNLGNRGPTPSNIAADPYVSEKVVEGLNTLISKKMLEPSQLAQSSASANLVGVDGDMTLLLARQIPHLLKKIESQQDQIQDLDNTKRILQMKCDSAEAAAQTESASLKQKNKVLGDENEALRKSLQSLMIPTPNESQDPRIKILEGQLQSKKRENEDLTNELAHKQVTQEKDARTIEDLRNQLLALLDKKVDTNPKSSQRDPSLESSLSSFIRTNPSPDALPVLPIIPATVEIDRSLITQTLETAKKIAAQNALREQEIADVNRRLQQALLSGSGSADVDALRKRVDVLTEERDSLSKQLNQEKIRIQPLERDLARLNEEISTLGGLVPKMHQEIETLQRDIERLEKQIKEAKDKAASAEAKLIESQQEVASLKRAFSTQPGSTSGQSTIPPEQLQTLEREVSRASQKHPSALQSVRPNPAAILSGDISTATQALGDLSARLEEANNQLRTLSGELTDTKDRLKSATSALDKEREDARTKVAAAQAEVSKLKEELFQLQIDNATVRQNPTSSVSVDPATLQREITALKQDLQRQERETKDAKDKAAQAEVAVITKNEEITKLKLQLDRATKDKDGQKAPHDPEVSDLLAKADRILDGRDQSGTRSSQTDTTVPKERTVSTLKSLIGAVTDSKTVSEENARLRADLEDLKNRFAALEAQNTKQQENLKSKLSDKDDELKKIKSEKLELEIQLAKLNSELKNLQEQVGGNQLSNRGLSEEVEALKDREGRLQSEIANLKDLNLKQELEILKLEQDRSMQASDRSNTGSNLEDIDPKLLMEAQRLLSQVFSKKYADESPSSPIQHAVKNSMFKDFVNSLSALLQLLEKSAGLVNTLQEEKQSLLSKISEMERKLKQEEQKLREEREKCDRMKDTITKSERDFTTIIADLNDKLANSVSKQTHLDALAKAQGENDDKKGFSQVFERELATAKGELNAKQAKVDELERELADKSSRLISMEGLRTRAAELEEEKKRQLAQATRTQEGLMDDIKALRSDNQNLRGQLDTLQARAFELERLVKQAQSELQDARRKQQEGTESSLSQEELLRSQEAMIRELQDQDSKNLAELRRVKMLIERQERELETLRSSVASKTSNEVEHLKTIAGLTEQIEHLQVDMGKAAKKAQDLERDNESLREKANTLKQMLETSLDASEHQLKSRMVQLEVDLERSRVTESETSSKYLDLANELKMERGRRASVESELDQSRINMRKLLAEFDDLKHNQKGLVEKNMELQKKLLVLKADTSMDNKFHDLEDEMNRLKNTNDDLNQKLKEINDELRSTHNKERSLSKENSDLKVKMKNEAIQKIREGDRSRDISQREMSPTALEEREALSALKTKSLKNVPAPSIQKIDYGPVFDLKMKNSALQQEISIMRNKLSELQNRERMENAREQTLMASQSRLHGFMMSPSRKPEASNEKGAVERLLEDMESHTAHKSPQFAAIEIPNPQRDTGLPIGEVFKIRDENRSLLFENQQLKNKISLLQSELITLAHNRIPAELTTPLMVMNQQGELMNPLNMSHDISELAKNVKKETQAITELNNTLSRREQMSPGRRGAGQGVSVSVDKGAEKSLTKRIKELEEMLVAAERTVADLQNKLDKKERRLKEMNEYILNVEEKGTRKTDNLMQENKELSQKVLLLNQQLKELQAE